MPTLNIEGRKVRVDDSFLSLSPEDQQATVEEIAAQLGIGSQSDEASGYAAQAWGGLDTMLEKFATTAKGAGWQSGSEFLSGLTDKPEGYVSAGEKFINSGGEGFNWQDLPGAAVEQSPQTIGSMGARGAGAGIGAGIGSMFGPGGAAVGAVGGALAGPALFEFAQQIGPLAYERARNNGYEEPTIDDWKEAAKGSAFSGLLNAIGIFGVGKLNSLVGIGKNVLKEGATEAAQSVVEQGTETIGTKKGAYIDLKQAVGEGIIGGTSAGGVDSVRNAKPMVDQQVDSYLVDRAMRKDPYARERAEITDYVNQLDERPTQGDAPINTREVNSYKRDLINQTEEQIKKIGLAPEDKQALIKGLKEADGLSDERLNEIAGRSESPSEIKAIARRVQLVRSMTAQIPAPGGVRGALATTARLGGGAAGAAIGQALGTGAVEGAYIGQNLGRSLAQKISNAKTQGANIDSLIGTKQARRARLLLERYGPSRATEAMNTLTEKAAAKQAQQEQKQQAETAMAKTMAQFKAWNAMRNKSLDAERKATDQQEKAKLKAERLKQQKANREARLEILGMNRVKAEAQAQQALAKLEAQKSLNALTVEAAQVQNDMRMAKGDFEKKNLEGRLEKLSLDIQMRQEALKKLQIATRNKEKAAKLAPEQAGKAIKTAKTMGIDVNKLPQLDQFGDPIRDPKLYGDQTERIKGLEENALAEAEAFPDREIGNQFIKAIRLFQSYRGRANQQKRMAVLENLMDELPAGNVEAQRFVNKWIVPLAYAFEAKTGAPQSSARAATVEEDIPF